jgi:hypothetical protein
MIILIACRRRDEFERTVSQLRFHFTEIRGLHDPSDYLDLREPTPVDYVCAQTIRKHVGQPWFP